MGTSVAKRIEPLADGVKFDASSMMVRLLDGREIKVPLSWFPRLKAASPAQRKRWRLIGRGIGIHWPAIDEDLSVAALLSR